MSRGIKRRSFEILEAAGTDDMTSKVVDIFIMALITLNVAAVILETVSTFSDNYILYFHYFEIFSVTVFTIEYILRLWSCTSEDGHAHPVFGRVRFSLKPALVVDLLAILPFFLPMVTVLDLRTLRALRLFRLFRVLKVARYSTSIKTINNVVFKKKEELIVSLSVLLVLLVISSSLMYFIEHEAQPNSFSSIPAAMWWGVTTLSTVGYGDMFPVTVAGKTLGTVVSFIGIALFALPAGILGSGFVEEMRSRRSNNACPHCNTGLD